LLALENISLLLFWHVRSYRGSASSPCDAIRAPYCSMVEWSGRGYRLYRSFHLSITAVRRSSLFLTSAGPPQRQKARSSLFVQTTIFIAIVMVVTDSGIASAGASHVVGRLGILDGPHGREHGCLTRAVNYA